MEDRNCELLFHYLKSILYDAKIEPLRTEELDEPYQKLGKGLQFLQKAVEEMIRYSGDLSKGNLSAEFPAKDNLLCVNLKNLHANLNHLTWQAKQVAAGDYSQTVSYLGEFSEAFNSMTKQLKEREQQLLLETEEMKNRAAVIEGYNELFVELTKRRQEWIAVLGAEKKEILYCNKQENAPEGTADFCKTCRERLSFREELNKWSKGKQGKVREWQDKEGRYYRITTLPLEWKGKKAFAHIILDITDEERNKRELEKKAYDDPVTHIGNRLLFEERMHRVLNEKKDATLCYIDIDGLKAVNDRFGHGEGDEYIRRFAALISGYFRNTDLFARVGGDEFCVMIEGKRYQTMERKMSNARNQFAEFNDKEYLASFSYGIVEIDGKKGNRLEDILKNADAAMYECKKKHKMQRESLNSGIS